MFDFEFWVWRCRSWGISINVGKLNRKSNVNKSAGLKCSIQRRSPVVAKIWHGENITHWPIAGIDRYLQLASVSSLLDTSVCMCALYCSRPTHNVSNSSVRALCVCGSLKFSVHWSIGSLSVVCSSSVYNGWHSPACPPTTTCSHTPICWQKLPGGSSSSMQQRLPATVHSYISSMCPKIVCSRELMSSKTLFGCQMSPTKHFWCFDYCLCYRVQNAHKEFLDPIQCMNISGYQDRRAWKPRWACLIRHGQAWQLLLLKFDLYPLKSN